MLDDTPAWQEHRKTVERVQLYLPSRGKPVRGIFVCYVFHSSDPRELARLWNFALVTIPTPFEYDLGFHDKRNMRWQKSGLKLGNMGVLLTFLDAAAKERNRPELASVPIVGWLGQNGAPLCADLFARAPHRVLAWTDAWYPAWLKYPEMIAIVPVASAWEFNEKEKLAVRQKRSASVQDHATPPLYLNCYSTTYGFPHGIYSKYNFFVAYLDRTIQARLPAAMPEPGKPVPLKPIDLNAGWAGNLNEISQWASIVPAAEAKGMIEPVWMPDEYAAWMWRSSNSANPDLKLTAPAIEYKKGGSPECGVGYGAPLKAGALLTFSASAAGTYQKIEFHDGDHIVGTAEAAPWKIDGIKLERGLRVLFAVGVTKEGTRTASRPAFVIVE